jgi:hypothetical protein
MTLPDNGATEENISAESPFPFLIHITGTSAQLLFFPLLNAEVQRKQAFLPQEADPGTSAEPFSVDNNSWLL